MLFTNTIALTVAAVALTALPRPADVPPADALLLSEVVARLDAREKGVITGIEFDDGLWEAEIRDGRTAVKVYLQPSDGSEVRRRTSDPDEQPPANAKPLAEILTLLEKDGIGVIHEVEFDDGLWEIEARKDGRDVELKADPVTGKRVRG